MMQARGAGDVVLLVHGLGDVGDYFTGGEGAVGRLLDATAGRPVHEEARVRRLHRLDRLG